MSISTGKSPGTFFGALVAGTLVALAGMIVLGPLVTAIDLSSDEAAPRLIEMLSALFGMGALFVGCWVAVRASEGASASLTGAAVWCVTAVLMVRLEIMGFDVPGFGLLAGGEGDEVLLPFSRYEAWTRFFLLTASLAVALLGAWVGAYVHGHDLVNRLRRWRRRALLKGAHEGAAAGV